MAASFSNLHVAILSSPGVGHLIPALLLANRLAAHHRVKVTLLLVTAAEAPSDTKLLNIPTHELVQLIELPPVAISHLIDSSTQVTTQICLMLRAAAPLVRSAVAAMDPRPDALVVDIFATEMLPIAAELNVAKFVYIYSTAWFAALTAYLPLLDREIDGEYINHGGLLKIPGCKPVRPEDVVSTMLDRSDQQYLEHLRMGREMVLFDGILINSWKDVDPKTLLAFKQNDALKPVIKIPVYPIGPLNRPVHVDDSDRELMTWLDQQPNESVIFVSFGSGGMLSQQQMTELAWGLELSRQRFVWVVRAPTTNRVDDAFFSRTGASNRMPNYLPNGFTTRVQDVGFLVPMWAQQARVLGHRAVGGFLSHCGWNSTLESLINGVPMIAWPLYAEQKMNAAFLVEEVRVALRPQAKEVVGRGEIEGMVRTLMEGEEGQCLREKAKKLKMSAIEALEVGGSSHNSMCELLAKIASKRMTNR